MTETQIVGEEAFQRKVRTQMRKLQKDLAEKKHFKDLFAALEVKRADHQYLKQHIQLLCEVMSGIGNKMGWVGPKTIEKLIYVAFLHDIRLIEFPKLARIQSRKEFEVLKPRLTSAEQKAFLEAPMYAAELARKDSESYSDAITILSQQKELPDGSGFPHALTGPQLAPLSCLFILSHYFVDYIIHHPDWTIADFKRTYRPKLKSPHFQKIFQSMDE